MTKRNLIGAGILFLIICAVILIIPSTRSSVDWRVDQILIRLRSLVSPPQDVSFNPKPTGSFNLDATLTALAPTPTLEGSPTPEQTQIPITTPTQTPTPLPESASIKGGKYFSQHNYFNYCAPANLAMAMSYWGWDGDIQDVGAGLKPYPKDKNVMPYEMEDYARSQGLGAITRVGGDLDTIKRLISAGFPVLLEKGVFFHDLQGSLSWMGHYQVVTGYDDKKQKIIAQDSFIKPNYEQSYDSLLTEWKGFNHTFTVLYPPEKEQEVLDLLGEDADETQNLKNAYLKASELVYQETGMDQFFDWYNIGTNLVRLQDFNGAAQAYDEAFIVYNNLPKELNKRPYRILWYQTGPYFAYYYTGRYWDVINYATENSIKLVRDNDPALEESYYWRGMARQALGDLQGAIEDQRQALIYHTGFPPSIQALQSLGVNP
jgi:tetratricopeptide (TPR) repeat protein